MAINRGNKTLRHCFICGANVKLGRGIKGKPLHERKPEEIFCLNHSRMVVANGLKLIEEHNF